MSDIENKKRTITSQEKEELLSLKPNDITKSLLQSLFANTYDKKTKKMKPSRFNTFDEFDLKANEYFNKENIKTNCGLFIFNKFIIEPDLQDVIGYWNEPLSKKAIGKIQSKLDELLMEDNIDTMPYINYLDRLTWLALTFNTEICTSLTIKSMKELPEVKKQKQQLIKKYENDLTSEDNTKATIAATKIEHELVSTAKELMKDDPAYELYTSGARGAFDVAYKNNQIMKGPVYNSSRHKYDIMFQPLSSGIAKSDIPTLANGAIDGFYQKSIAPGDCGYTTKKLNAMLQSAVLDKKGSDCHTQGYNVVTLNEANYTMYSYCYIIEGSKLVRLDSKTKSKYMGKTVKIRSNAYCTNKNKTCNMCAGDKYYLLGNDNFGLTAARLSNSLLNLRMKAVHAAVVSYYNIDIDKDFV